MPNVTALVTSDEIGGLGVTLHRDEDEAYAALGDYLRNTPVSYQDPLPEDAPNEDIQAAANDRSQFQWDIQETVLP